MSEAALPLKIETAASKELFAAVRRFSRKTGAPGASFVTIGVRQWAQALAECNPKATADYLRALADMCEPGASHEVRVRALALRYDAEERLTQSVASAQVERERVTT